MAGAAGPHSLKPRSLKRLHRSLERWFGSNARSFPWREAGDPYQTLLAEKLLQQTAAKDHVVAAYCELVDRYPTPSDLAAAGLEDVQDLLFPLGLRRRPQELIELAGQLVSEHDGRVPQEASSLRSLPGVGEYIARAVLCFGFGLDVAIVDTNIARWLHRLLLLPGPMPKNPARNRALLDLAGQLLPRGNARRYHWAVLDLCASICTARKPKCPDCPVQRWCACGRERTDPRP